MRRWLARLVAAVVGGLLALAFAPVNLWWLAWVALMPLILLCAHAASNRDAAVLSWFAGVGFFAATQHWLLPWLGFLAPVVLGVAGLFWVPFGIAAQHLLRDGRRPLLALVVLPSMWVTMEAVRSWEYLGGPWNLLGASQWTVRPVLATAALGGTWLLSFLLVAVNAALACTIMAPRRSVVVVVAAAALVAGALAWGFLRPDPVVTGHLRIAGVQPGVIHDGRARVAEQLRLTAGVTGADVVVWGQSSVPFDPASHPALDEQLRDAASVRPLLVNVDAQGADGRITKSARLYTADGVVARYDKQRLVPFGEYIPLRPVLGWLGEYTQAAAVDRMPGDHLVVMEVAGARVGVLISYESTFADLRRELVRMGAEVTVVQGSLTTFQGSWAHAQQASFEAVRAVASGRTAVLVEMSGTSAAFDPAGRSLAWVGHQETGTFVVDAPLTDGRTPYVVIGDAVPAAAAIVSAMAALAAGWRRIRRA